MSLLSLHKICKQFNQKTVLRDISLDVRDGEFLVLVGPSGCGKSTLLRILAGLDSPCSGELILDGRDITRLVPKQRNFSLIFQNYALFPHLSVEANITFGMRIRGESKSLQQQQLQKVTQLLQLEPLLQAKPGQLSGGQRQRVAMARAIVRSPALFLMDEPLSNLDAKLRSEVRQGIMQLHQELKTSTVYVTHDQTEAMTMADRIAVLNQGVLQQLGTPEELYFHPANRFVASFIGAPAMNLTVVSPQHLQLPMDQILPPQHTHERSVILGIRPEHIMEGEASAGIPSITVSGQVCQKELHGAEYLIQANTTIGRLNYRRPSLGVTPAIGDRLTLSFAQAQTHFFSTHNEQNLTFAQEQL